MNRTSLSYLFAIIWAIIGVSFFCYAIIVVKNDYGSDAYSICVALLLIATIIVSILLYLYNRDNTQ